MPRLSISTWSLHRNLGPMYGQGEDGSLAPHDSKPGALSLLDVPNQIADRGIRTLEICHFHFPRTDNEYVLELRSALESAGVELFSILIDGGDITSTEPEKRAADMKWI